MHWANDYVGIPYVSGGRDRDRDGGLDCYGLIRVVYAAELGVEIDELRVTPDDGRVAVDGEFEAQAQGTEWLRVEDDAREFDIVWARNGLGSHCGVALNRSRMLHTIEGHDASVTRQECRLWTVIGRYRQRA